MSKYVLPKALILHLNSPSTIPHADVILERNWITYNDLLYIHTKYLIDRDIPLSDLLKGLQFYKPPTKQSSYTPEFTKQLDTLRAKLEEESYQKLVHGGNSGVKFSTTQGDDEDVELTPSQMQKKVNEQLTTILNIFISVGSVVYAIWYWTSNNQNLAYRVLLCLFVGILILVAEVVVYNSFIRKLRDARVKEKGKKEAKKVVDTIVFNGGDEELEEFMKVKKKTNKIKKV